MVLLLTAGVGFTPSNTGGWLQSSSTIPDLGSQYTINESHLGVFVYDLTAEVILLGWFIRRTTIYIVPSRLTR